MQKLLFPRKTEFEIYEEMEESTKMDFITFINHFIEWSGRGFICKICLEGFENHPLVSYNHWHMKHNKFYAGFRMPPPWFQTNPTFTKEQVEEVHFRNFIFSSVRRMKH